jgi:hypothetical protein
MGKADRTRIEVSIKTALMSFFILYPSTKFLPILKSGRLGMKVGSISLDRDEILCCKG